MSCGVCQQTASARRKPVCISCAQALLLEPRLSLAEALLSREKSHTHVEAVVRPGNDGILAALPEDADWDAITSAISSRSHERARTEKDAIEIRLESISEKAKELQQQVEDHKRYIAEHQKLHQQRRAAITSERQELAKRKSQAFEPVQAAIKRANRHLDKIHTRTADAREFLVKEVGALCGLRHVQDKKGRSEFYLDGLPIPNLKDLNCINGRIRGDKVGRLSGQPLSEPHEVISASLDNVCLFLGVCCYYLSIRLPAEVILPHDDFPHSALMQREASYRVGEVRYPGIGSTSSSPAQSRTLHSESERGKARLVQLHRPLTHLQKQDPKTYALFLEGTVLLAYNIAWLCRTQGVVVGTPSFDDICDLGKNLYALAGKDSRHPLERRNTSDKANAAKKESSSMQFGRFSHISANGFLAGHQGLEMFAPDVWRVSVTTVTDRLKSYLSKEASRSEWHYIEDTEWDDVLEHEQAVMVGGASVIKRPIDAKGPAMSIMSVAPHDGAEAGDAKANASQAKSNSGWTKLRGRGGDAA